MRCSRIFHDAPLTEGSAVELPKETALYLLKVLRLPIGSSLTLFNGDGNDYSAKLIEARKQGATVEIETSQMIENESPVRIHLAQCISRSNKMDFVIQKSVELGVNEITPIVSQFSLIKLSSERWENKISHWKKVLISACEQSGRACLPTFNPPIALYDWVKDRNEESKLILHPHHKTKSIFSGNEKSACLLIGPEGGFSETELTEAKNQGFANLQLGKRILRTETAALAGITFLQTKLGDYAS